MRELRTPWVCTCGVFNSHARVECRSCRNPRLRPEGGGPRASDPRRGTREELDEIVADLQRYLSGTPGDIGVERAVGALEQARPYLEKQAPSREAAALISGAHLALSARASMGAAPLQDTVERLLVLRDSVMRRILRGEGRPLPGQ